MSPIAAFAAGSRSLLYLLLGLGLLTRVMAFDNTKKDNVRAQGFRTCLLAYRLRHIVSDVSSSMSDAFVYLTE